MKIQLYNSLDSKLKIVESNKHDCIKLLLITILKVVLSICISVLVYNNILTLIPLNISEIFEYVYIVCVIIIQLVYFLNLFSTVYISFMKWYKSSKEYGDLYMATVKDMIQ